MKKVLIKRVKFKSFIALSIYVSLILGFIFGAFMFLIGLVGGNVTVSFGNVVYHGFVAGIIGLFLSPFMFIFFALGFGSLIYLALKRVIRLKKAFIICDYEVIEDYDTLSINETSEICEPANND